MLEDFIRAISGAATSTAYTYPTANGINGVSPKQSFGMLFNNLASSLNNTPQAIFGGGFPQGGNIDPRAIQAYRNVQFNSPKGRAFAPGAAVFDSSFGQVPERQVPPSLGQTLNQGLIQPNSLANLSPLSGSTFQNSPGINSQGGGSFGMPFVPGAAGTGGNGFSKLQSLLFPVISLFSLFKSLFGLRQIISSLKPETVNREDLNFYQSQNSFQEYESESEEGYFDPAYPELVEHENFDLQKMEEL